MVAIEPMKPELHWLLLLIHMPDSLCEELHKMACMQFQYSSLWRGSLSQQTLAVTQVRTDLDVCMSAVVLCCACVYIHVCATEGCRWIDSISNLPFAADVIVLRGGSGATYVDVCIHESVIPSIQPHDR